MYKYGTTEMKDEEVLLFVDSSLANNEGVVSEAIQDMRMIDTMLQAHKMHKVVHVYIKKTGAGHTRRSAGFLDTMSSIVSGRLNGAFDY